MGAADEAAEAEEFRGERMGLTPDWLIKVSQNFTRKGCSLGDSGKIFLMQACSC